MTSRSNIFQTLPKETYQKILLNLSPRELIRECQTDVHLNKICMIYDLYFWNNYIAEWYKYKHPNDYGYDTWNEVINIVNPNNLLDFLKFLNKYKIGKRTNIEIIIADIDLPQNFNEYDIEYIEKNDNLFKIRTKSFIDDTVGDLLDRILRLYKISSYKNNEIEYIKILCYNYGVIEYDLEDNKLIFYIAEPGNIEDIKELNIDDKLIDIDVYESGRNFFGNLLNFGMVYIKFKNN